MASGDTGPNRQSKDVEDEHGKFMHKIQMNHIGHNLMTGIPRYRGDWER